RDPGGEPVPQSPGVLNIALSYALGPGDNEQTRIETAYLRLCQPICDWLRERGLDAGVGAVAGSFCDGRYNVTLDGRKLAGTAQRWRRNGAGRPVVLAHAALLVGAEREEMVEVVNTFTRRCASAPDCQADSHLGLSERWSDFRMADSLELERRFIAARS
ncbi:lipoate--protein ligase family protein, partial [Pseudomonas aeruginosa]|uniref:lipoate--protein ligase family protein n=1 Tax=Pseudomonas aeruginosa TaxID=287 RepID=UPI000676F80A